MDTLDQCANCFHHRGEHNSHGACFCDVLETPPFGEARWLQCPCIEWQEPDE